MSTVFNTQVGNGKYCLQFETDNKAHYLIMQSSARRCVDRAHMTNADRVRAMSDEELAEEIGRSSIPELCDIVCGVDCKAAATFNTTLEKRCADFVLDWLQQPAEVNE